MSEILLHRQFESQAATAPERIALVSGAERVSYGELNARANRLAWRLREHGIGETHEAVVGIRLERGIELVTAILAVLKAGGVCLLMDPDYPPERLRLIAEEAAPRLTLMPGDTEIAGGCEGNPVVACAPEDLAFLLYTSGSTGAPKGVMLTHGGRGRRQAWTARRYGASPEERHLVKSPVGFGTLVREIFWPLTTGASAVIARRGGHRDCGYLIGLMREHSVSIANFVPSLLRELLEHPEIGACGSLRHVFATGEALPPDLRRRFFEKLPGAELHLFYGSTEAPTSTFRDFRADDPGEGLTLGRPADVPVYILDESLRPVADGTAGELYIGGTDIARGYYRRPEATAERFLRDPFSDDSSARLFRTGDWGRRGGDGGIAYLGRTDEQVKIRGCRVELQEVAAALRAERGVRDAAALVCRDGDREQLVAFYVAGREAPADGELRQRLAARLPGFMLPDRLLPLERLPIDAHGKLHRAALAELARRENYEVADDPPRGDVERVVAEIVAASLGVAAVGRDRNFFESGGHSLAAMRALGAFQRRFGVEIGVEAFYRGPTVRQIAEQIERLRRAGPAATDVPRSGDIDRTGDKIAGGTGGATACTGDKIAGGTGGATARTGSEIAGGTGGATARTGSEIAGGTGGATARTGGKIAGGTGGATACTGDKIAGGTGAGTANTGDKGGHWLKASEVLARLTPSGAAQLRRCLPDAEAVVRVAPLSAAQRQIWFVHRLHPERPEYNVSAAYRIEGAFDAEALRAALGALVRRHEVLRGAAVVMDGEPCQVIVPEATADLTVESAPESEAPARLAAFTRRPLDLAAPPHVHALVVRHSEDRASLVLVLPHFVHDAASRRILARDLSLLYRAVLSGSAPELPELPLPYDQAAESRGTPEALARWVEILRDRPPMTEIAGETPFAQAVILPEFHEAGRSVRDLPRGLAADLRSLSARAGLTLSTTLLAAFALLISRHSNSDDIVIGVPVSGRRGGVHDDLIGCFINMLPLRVRLAEARDFAGLLGCVKESLLRALADADVPLHAIVEALNPERSAKRNPLFEIFFNFIRLPHEPLRLGSARALPLELPEAGAKFDLAFYVYDEGADLRLKLSFRRALYSQAWADGVLEQFETLLRQIADGPSAPLEELSLVAPGFAAHIPDLRQPIAEEAQEPVIVRFRRIAAQHPEAVALTAGGERHTYAQLAAAAEQIARRLHGRGMRPGDTVAIVGHRCPELLAALLGVLDAGGAFLLIAETLPAARQEVLRKAAEARFTWRIGQENGDCAAEAWQRPAIDSEQPACICFTSGSSGQPRPVIFAHKGVAHHVKWMRETLGAGPDDRVAMMARLGFDALLREIFVPLTSGATLSIPPGGELASASEMVEWLAAERITVLGTVPAVAQTWMASLFRPVPLPHLRWTMFTGEPLTDALVRRWRASFPQTAAIGNIYGATETTLGKTFYRVPDPPLPGTQSIGPAMSGAQVFVMAPSGRMCGMGEIGEILIRTPYVGRGYLGHADKQQEKYRRNPLRGDPADILYHSGDLGRWRADGLIEILDRIDRQVKILGARVEPLEVELALAGLPGVAEAAVTAQKTVSGENMLAAYVVASDGAAPTASGIAAGLRELLPAHMIPSAIVLLPAMPRSANGKLDRKALPAATPERVQRKDSYVAPRNPLELRLVRLWEELLPGRIGVTDNFFESGGHSLLAIRMMARVEQELGRALAPSVLLPHATVEHLALVLRDANPAAAGALVPLQPANGQRPNLFCMHPAGGSVLCYLDLARCLGADQPVYGLQGPDPRGGADPPEDAGVLAAQFLAAIRAVQPHGPYHLAGFSFGGIIAFEMARLLLGQGETVGLLALLDTGYPRTCGMRNDGGLIDELAALLEHHDLSDGPADEDAEHRLWQGLMEMAGKYLPANGGRKARGMSAVQEFFRAYRFLPTGEEIGYADIRRYLRFLRANIRTAYRYRPVPIAARLTLFRAEEELPHSSDDPHRKEMWSTLTTAGMETIAVPGNHLNLLGPPAVELLAARLRERIA